MSMIDAISIAKSMKKPIVHISPDYILGTDVDFCTISVIIYPSDIPRAFTAKLTDIYTSEEAEKLSIENVFEFNKLQKLGDLYIDIWEEPLYYNRIMQLYRNLTLKISNAPVIDILDLKQYDTKSTLKMKSSDRHRWQYLDFEYSQNLSRYIMSSFVQLHPVNASDKVNLKIYDVDEHSFIACFEIIKKKNIVVNEYIRYLYLT